MIERLLMATSAGIPLVLGTLHLLYTFRGPKLLPRDASLRAAMERTHMVITRETTVWRAWLGFNATHSIALILFGLFFGFLAIEHAPLLFASPFLLVLGFGVLCAFLTLARLYFFSIPFKASAVALTCYVASIVLALA